MTWRPTWLAPRRDAISRDIRFLVDLLGEVIVELEGRPFFDLEERVRSIAKSRRSGHPAAALALRTLIAEPEPAVLSSLVKAFSSYFQLVNLAEEAQRVRTLRIREAGGALSESLGEAADHVARAEMTPAEKRDLVKHLRATLVFTAHPTESKRSVVLAKLRTLAEVLTALENEGLLPRERERQAQRARATIVGLWQTRTARVSRPPVSDEVFHTLYFLTETLLEVAPQIERDLGAELAAATGEDGWDLSGLLRFGTWAGGDRDGNPFVTPRTTIEALEIASQEARQHYEKQLRRLLDQLSQSDDEVGISDALARALQDERREDPALAESIGERYPSEPYRQHIAFVSARLSAGRIRTRRQLLNDLRVVDQSLRANGAASVADEWLSGLISQVEIFGLTLARMEVRQHSDRHHEAIAELFLGDEYREANSSERCKQLLQLIAAGARPPLGGSAGAEDTWMTFRSIAEAHARFGPDVLHTYIISMTRGLADILAVQALATLAGVAGHLDIVPLFETGEDLEASAGVMGELYESPVYSAHLRTRENRQQVMIGYSDSNKSEGYLAAHWQLYEAQRALAATSREHGIELEVFHGRGGTTARGGGPTNRAILGQPPGTVRGRIKITEQGEVISERYANREIAYRHLSQLVNALVRASLPAHDQELPEAWSRHMSTASNASRGAYDELLAEPGFLTYLAQSTPLNEIGHLTIGSRPARRQAGMSVESLRAIPWVFSWMQCRANVPGWFGLGAGLTAAAAEGAPLDEMYRQWHFFRTVVDNAEMALSKSDLSIASLYTELVEDTDIRGRIFSLIAAEYERTLAMILQVTGHTVLLEASPELRLSIERRNPYVDPLNYIQVELLRRLRAAPAGSPEHDELLKGVFQTINGIAAGLRNTG
ncbi:MAG: phosphoenolpyruvate carboxylase [Dehalococcoidia bacterium]